VRDITLYLLIINIFLLPILCNTHYIIFRRYVMDDKAKIIENLLQELKRGTLVLSVLLNADESCYGYSLVTKLQDRGVDIEQNTLYPLMRRLEKQGLLFSNWDTSESRPRKYYKISDEGTEILKVLKDEWVRTNQIINSMISREESK
jgi:PadR family transcriptional regulator